MQFRPCIDIHNGKVKQIVGGSLKDEGNAAKENFVAEKNADYYAALYREEQLEGAHIILLNARGSEYYEATRQQAMLALGAYPGHMQIGGGITAENAQEYLDAGADKVIVTSYVFQNGEVNWQNLKKLCSVVGKEHIVLDLSCRRRGDNYYIVTDRWQKDTNVALNADTLDSFYAYCSEYLIHAVDVEGKNAGIEQPLVELLGEWNRIPITYAGGVHSFADLELLGKIGKGRIHVTIGSALDLFGGQMSFGEVVRYVREHTKE